MANTKIIPRNANSGSNDVLPNFALCFYSLLPTSRFIVCIPKKTITNVLHNSKRKDSPRPIADFKDESIADEDNAAKFLADAQSHILAIDIAMSDLAVPSWGESPNPDFIETFKQIFQKHIHAYIAIEEASLAPDFDLPGDFEISSEALTQRVTRGPVQLRSIARIAMYRSRVQIHERELDAAASTLLQALRVIDRSKLPTLLASTSACAAEGIVLYELNLVLQSGELATETRDKIATQLQQLDDMDSFKHALITERAFGISAAKEGRAGFGNFGGTFLDTFEYYLDRFDQLPHEWEEPKSAAIQSSSIAPAILTVQQSKFRNISLVRALKIVNFAKRPNQSPQQIQSFSAGVIDPYSGEPMRVRRAGGDWIAYSVGRNRKDDGGEIDLHKQLDFGFGPIDGFN